MARRPASARRWVASLAALAALAAPAARTVPAAHAVPGESSQSPAPAPAPAHRQAHWVFFRDRGAATQAETGRSISAGAGAGFLSARAVMRRDKTRRARGRAGAALLAPEAAPAPSYVAAVSATGAVLRTESRWLNAVSVDADDLALRALRALPFVAGVRPVARSRDARSESRARARELDPPAGGSPAADAGADPHAERGDVADAGPSYPQLARIGIPEAHALGYHGEGVLIGVLDTGFTLEHEALRALRATALRDFVQGDDDPRNDPSRAPRDVPSQHNHGTQVLSLLGAYAPGRMIGAAYGSSFLLAKTERIDVERPFEEDLWCAGLEWVEAMGADIATTSITFDDWYRAREMDGRTAVTSRMANLAWERGLLLVNAAGNYGPAPSTVGAPGDAPYVLAVGATDVAGRLAAFSSRGPTGDGRVKPDVVAPGADVLLADARTRDGYTREGGTSYAAPLVAGVAALVIQAHPDWGPEAVREAIAMSADRADRPAPDYGWGMVDARAAILFPFLEGTVRAADRGAPIAGAAVAWERLGDVEGAAWAAPGDAPPHGTTRTGVGGAYTIANLPPGVYRLTVGAEGYQTATLGPFDVPPNLRGVDAALHPAR